MKIYDELYKFLSKRPHESYSIYQLCEMLEHKFGELNPQFLKINYFDLENDSNYFNFKNLKKYQNENLKNFKLLENYHKNLFIILFFIFFIISLKDESILFFCVFSLISFICIGSLIYLEILYFKENKNFQLFNNSIIAIYPIIFIIINYLTTTKDIKSYIPFALNENIDASNGLYIITISNFIYTIIKLLTIIPKKIYLSLFYILFIFIVCNLMIINNFNEYFLLPFKICSIIIFVLFFLKRIYDIRYDISVSMMELHKNYNKYSSNFFFIVILLSTIVFLTFTQEKNEIKNSYYNFLKVKNDFYCENIPYNNKLIINSNNFNTVLLDINDIDIIYLKSFIINNHKNIKYLETKEGYFNIFHYFLTSYINDKENFENEFYKKLKNDNFDLIYYLDNEQKYRLIIQKFLKTNGKSNLFSYKCE